MVSSNDGTKGGGLPRGPHGLSREEVETDQRHRLVHAMIEEIAIHGYESTTVEHLIKRAGVSRKTFYARFASREELLLLAFDTASTATLKPVQQASRRTGGSTRQLEAAIRRLCRSAREEPGAIELCTIDVTAARPAGITRRETLMDAYGRLFQRCLEPNTEQPILPPALPPILSGAIHRVIDSRLRTKRELSASESACSKTSAARRPLSCSRMLRAVWSPAPRVRRGRSDATGWVLLWTVHDLDSRSSLGAPNAKATLRSGPDQTHQSHRYWPPDAP